MAWRRIGLDLVLAIHDRQLSAHGGLSGVRDLAAVESALTRARNLL
jgi:death-on-curing protein